MNLGLSSKFFTWKRDSGFVLLKTIGEFCVTIPKRGGVLFLHHIPALTSGGKRFMCGGI